MPQRSPQLLILDLDDTIFETQSISPRLFQPVITIVEDYYVENFGLEKAQSVVKELWEVPFDVVAKKHHMPAIIQSQLRSKLNELDYQLDIATFEDYPELTSLQLKKVLVTTGFTRLQEAKIQALAIQSDFAAIYIDNPFDKNRKHKKGIFSDLLWQSQQAAQDVWVIGDNPESEIKAGRELGMRTIQRLRPERRQSEYADYAIHSFTELRNILAI